MDNTVLQTCLAWLAEWRDFILLFFIGGLAIDLLGEFIKKPVLNHQKSRMRKKLEKDGKNETDINTAVDAMKVNPLFGFVTGAVLTMIGLVSIYAATSVPGGLPCIWLWYVLLLSYQAVAMPVGKAIMRKVFPGIVNPNGCICNHTKPHKPRLVPLGAVYRDDAGNIVDKHGNPIIDDEAIEEADVPLT